MEVIVDDSQLSLAIGKKGQNVRLAAKLLGWRIDIKSEEVKRQEVESQMAALVVSGAPVSVLIDHGLGEKVVEKLLEAGIGTIERLGSMTPEQLEEISGIGPKTVETIQVAVNSYYAQFEEAVPPETEQAAEGPETLAAAPDEGAAAPGLEPATAAQEEGAAEPAAEAAAAAQEESAAAPGAEPAAPQVEAPKPEEAPESCAPESDASPKTE
jgi:N utilization substance protein A